MRNSLVWFTLGVGSTVIYEQVKNGNFRKMVRNMNSKKTKLIEEIENIL